ncbi:MAG: HAD-IIA family hydrolase [Haloarculaceae archaeon]
MTYRGVVLDLDGTVYRHEDPVPGARETLADLRDRGLDLLFFSNNPTATQEGYAERLAGMGLDVAPAEIRSSASVTADYLTDAHDDDEVYFVGSSGLRSLLDARDVALTDDYEDPDVVLVSFYRGFSYDTMMEAMWALDGTAPFIGTDPDMTVPVDEGRNVPGSGAIINAVAGVADRDPDRIMGKPSDEAIREVRDALGHPPAECLVVGDRLDTDIALGERAGMETVLVLSGVTSRADVAAADVTPDHVVSSVADLPALLD